jgi:hypothetical protein
LKVNNKTSLIKFIICFLQSDSYLHCRHQLKLQGLKRIWSVHLPPVQSVAPHGPSSSSASGLSGCKLGRFGSLQHGIITYLLY